MLCTDLPMAWKNTGNVSENTAGMKLEPIILNAVAPISSVFSSFVNMPINVFGKN